MALINWGDEEDKKDDLFGGTAIKQIASVQGGSWQPAPSGADAPAVQEDDQQQGGIFNQPQQPVAQVPDPGNYLVSDQKAQVDEQKMQRDAEIAEARRQSAARAVAVAAAERSREFREGNAQDSQGQTLDVEEIKQDTGWKKYYDDAFKQEKDSLDFWGRLMDGGAASRRAETMARTRYNTELLNRAYDDNGNVLDANAANQAKKLAAYNSALAEDNSTRGRAAGEAIGAFDKNDSGFFGRLNDTVNAMRQMSAYDAVAGVDDKQNTGVDDVFRFGGNVIQGVATALPIGGKAIYEAGAGEGTDYTTGLQEELDAGERAGRAGSGAIDVVGTFLGGSGKLVQSLGAKVATKTATQAEKTLLKKLTADYVVPSLIEGGEAGAQAAAEYFGNDGTLLDENGEIDADKVAELLTQVGQSAVVGTAAGGVFTGTAAGVNRFRNRGGGANAGSLAENLPELEYTPVDDANIEFAPKFAEELAPIERTGVVDESTVTPVVAGENVSVENANLTPVGRNTPELLDIPEAPMPDGVVSTDPVGVSPIRDPELEAPAIIDGVPANVEAPVNVADVSPVADGIVRPADAPVTMDGVAPVRPIDLPVVRSEEIRGLQEARVGKNQAEEAVINQQLQQAEAQTPRVDENIPDEMATNIPGTNPDGSPMTRAEVAQRLMPLLDDSSAVKQQIADAVGMGKDTESPVREILREGGVKPRQAERVTTQFEALERQLQEYNQLEASNQKAYAEGGEDALDPNVSRDRSRVTRDMAQTMRRLMSEINRMEGSRDFKTRVVNNMTNIIGTRNASVLTSAGLVERNIAQEISANLKLMAKNPGKMLKSTFGNGNILKDTAKAELSNWKGAPRSPVEAVKYIVGNTYRTAMIPTTSLANTRRGAVREELTRWAYKELEGRDLSSAQAKKLSGTAGNEMEALVNTFIGVDNGMTNRKQATDALKAWKEYIRTGDDGAKTEFLNRVENHNSLADQMIAGLSKEDATRARGLMAAKNLIFPFVRTATNLMKTTVRQDLNPFAKSLLDEIRVDQRGGTANAINTIKSKLVDYGIMSGAAALASSGMIQYNDGDEVDKPRGWSIKVGDNEYVPIRATSLELPIALAGTAQAMASDIASGNPRDWQYYAGMVTGSLPYIDQMNTTTGAVDSLTSGEDEGYAARSYAVNTAKSFVPGSNNSIQPYVAGKKGESLNAKTVYDDNMIQWFKNTVQKSYDPDFYNDLRDSRDNAGRVRTIDNQGVVSNKTINDSSTAEFNDRITDLVEYGREAGLGKNTQDMFNTYDTGKNNNFKSVQDAITFLDAPEVNGKKTPDNTKKLEKNAKLTDLAQQIREGFYGDTGMDLLTLDGREVKSDVSVPNKSGSKSTKLPLSMQAIKNAIAATDLPADQNEMLNVTLAEQDRQLWDRFKNQKAISYEQYAAEKAKIGEQQAAILSNSESYQKLLGLMDELDETGFFDADGLGSTKSGQTYLWNSLNAMLASKGATPAAQYPEDDKGFTPWGFGDGKRASNKPGDRGNTGIRWSPVQARQMAKVADARFTPVNIKVKLGNEIKRDRSQNYSDRSF